MSNPFLNRHFDVSKKSWYIGENTQGIDVVKQTIHDFYERITCIIEVSDEIRLLNNQVSKIKGLKHHSRIGFEEHSESEQISKVAQQAAERLLNNPDEEEGTPRRTQKNLEGNGKASASQSMIQKSFTTFGYVPTFQKGNKLQLQVCIPKTRLVSMIEEDFNENEEEEEEDHAAQARSRTQASKRLSMLRVKSSDERPAEGYFVNAPSQPSKDPKMSCVAKITSLQVALQRSNSHEDLKLTSKLEAQFNVQAPASKKVSTTGQKVVAEPLKGSLVFEHARKHSEQVEAAKMRDKAMAIDQLELGNQYTCIKKEAPSEDEEVEENDEEDDQKEGEPDSPFSSKRISLMIEEQIKDPAESSQENEEDSSDADEVSDRSLSQKDMNDSQRRQYKLYKKLWARHMSQFQEEELEKLELEEDGQSSSDSFKQDFYQHMKRKQQRRNVNLRRTKQQNFNYLQITNADQVTQLIEKCQDSLDIDYINLFKAGKVLDKLIEEKRAEFLKKEQEAGDGNCLDRSFDSADFAAMDEPANFNCQRLNHFDLGQKVLDYSLAAHLVDAEVVTAQPVNSIEHVNEKPSLKKPTLQKSLVVKKQFSNGIGQTFSIDQPPVRVKRSPEKYHQREDTDTSVSRRIDGIPTNINKFSGNQSGRNQFDYPNQFSHYNPSDNGNSILGYSNFTPMSQNMKFMNNFSHPHRAGDGSDPFRRYQYCFNEFQQGFQSLVNEHGESQCEINIHALNCCLTTYMNNMKVILDILMKIKESLQNGRQELLTQMRRGHLPSFLDIHRILFKNTVLLSQAKQLCVQVIQFQTVQVFTFGAVTCDKGYLMYKPSDAPEWKEIDQFIQTVGTANAQQLEIDLRKSFKGMIKAGAAKTADIMIPQNEKFLRFKKFVEIYTTVSNKASEDLNYNMTMFCKEQDFIRYLRMSTRSPFMKTMYTKCLEDIACDQIIFVPMIDGINLSEKQVVKYEDPSYQIPSKDKIMPIITKAIKRQNVDFFLDERSHNERNSIQVRVLYSKDLAFVSKETVIYTKQNKKGNASCFIGCSAANKKQKIIQTAAQQNLKHRIEKVILHFHGGAFVCMSSFQHQNYTRQWANLMSEDNVVVFSVDYRLAPENPFPIPFSDCFQVYCWIVTQAFEQLGINPKQIIVTGDSAGGHLACAISQICIFEGFRKPDAVVMAYPSLMSDLKFFQPSLLLCLDDFLLSKDMLVFSLMSLHNEKIGNPYFNPLASPIAVQDHVLAQFPKTRVLFCERDPLRDATIQFIWRMKKLNVDLAAHLVKSWCHGVLSFDLRRGGIAESHQANLLMIDYFREIFQSSGSNGYFQSGKKIGNLQSPSALAKKKFAISFKEGNSMSSKTSDRS